MYCHVLRPFFWDMTIWMGISTRTLNPVFDRMGWWLSPGDDVKQPNPTIEWFLVYFTLGSTCSLRSPPKNIKKYITSNYSPVIEHCNWTSTIYRWFVQFKPRFIGDFRLPATFNYPRVSPRVFRPPFSHNTYYETYFYDQYPLDVSMKNNTLPAGKPLPHLAPHWWFFPR